MCLKYIYNDDDKCSAVRQVRDDTSCGKPVSSKLGKWDEGWWWGGFPLRSLTSNVHNAYLYAPCIEYNAYISQSSVHNDMDLAWPARIGQALADNRNKCTSICNHIERLCIQA